MAILFGAAIAFCLLSSLSAQLSISPRPTTSITISVTIPRILKLDLDFSQNSQVSITGMVGAHGASVFDLSNSGTASLGTAKLISNYSGSYVMTVASENGGKLVSGNLANQAAFEYTLMLGDSQYDLSHGSAVLNRSGFTGKAGSSVPVSISYSGLDGRTAPLQNDRYSDKLLFALASN